MKIVIILFVIAITIIAFATIYKKDSENLNTFRSEVYNYSFEYPNSLQISTSAYYNSRFKEGPYFINQQKTIVM